MNKFGFGFAMTVALAGTAGWVVCPKLTGEPARSSALPIEPGRLLSAESAR